ncbi:VOC family protein [Paraburkholderia sp. JPY432]|uniref:VOC family protein n=1 Tax=Paraburkholderia youngii TaxID=2782701 RepID=UPI0015954E48|nr:VOC family protein [Paraburkholderia youngii]NVH71930.1 VOC family protein [Paraburkholderia youngii]
MSQALKARFKHVGIHVIDVDRMVEFYQRWFGLVKTDEGSGPVGKGVFLSSDPTEHHQIVFVAGREPGSKSIINQLSFMVDGLPELKAYYKRAQDEDRKITQVKSHGNSLSLYVLDPEGNQMEIYWDTPWYVSQPVSLPLDLTQSDEEILAGVERAVRANPTFMMQDQWVKQARQLMAG